MSDFILEENLRRMGENVKRYASAAAILGFVVIVAFALGRCTA